MTSSRAPSSISSALVLAVDGVGCSRRTGGAPTCLARPLPSGSFLLVSGGAADPFDHAQSVRVLETYPVLAIIALGWDAGGQGAIRRTTSEVQPGSVAKRSRSRTGHTYAARRPCGLLQRALVNRRLGPRPRRPKRNPRRGTKTNSTPAFASCRLSTSPRVAMLCSSDAARPATSSFRTQRCCEASSSADAWR